MKRIKNNTAEVLVRCGMEIQPSAYYVIEPIELLRWQTDDTVISDISLGNLVMNDGVIDITGVSAQIDFLKDTQVRDINLASPFSSTGGFFARFSGMEGVAIHGTDTEIDYLIVEERYINGVRIIAKGAAWGDYLKFQVIHPIYGMVNEFGTKWYIDADNSKQDDVIVPYPAKLPAGVTVRILYTSVGETDVLVYANLYLHKKV